MGWALKTFQKHRLMIFPERVSDDFLSAIFCLENSGERRPAHKVTWKTLAHCSRLT